MSPAPRPYIGADVHYVSYGTPGGEYKPACRAAKITEVGGAAVGTVGLAVLNPTGLFFRSMAEGGVHYDAGQGNPGREDCPSAPHEDKPFRYCACGWSEAARVGGTWHWPED